MGSASNPMSRPGTYLDRLGSAVGSKRTTARGLERLFEEFLGVANAPAPRPDLTPYFHDLGILCDLAQYLYQPLPDSLRETVIERAQAQYYSPLSYFRIRRLGAQGHYPNVPLKSGPAWYAICHGDPYLIAWNSARNERFWGPWLSLTNWTRHETRLASATTCAE
jgi:hypothetical protein